MNTTSKMTKKEQLGGAVKEAQTLWSNLIHDKPVLPYLIPFFLLAWLLERWIIPFSNWIPVFVTVWATLQYGKYRREQAVEDVNNRWKRHILCSQPNTPLEPCEWLNKMLMNVWPNFMEPKLERKLLSIVQKRIKDKKPRAFQSMEVLEVALGTAPPMFGLQGSYWSTEGNQAVLHVGFEWDTNEMSVLIAAKLAGPLRGTVARIIINSIHVKGDLRILPILDGQGVLYSFANTPEIRVGVAFGSGSQSQTQTELPIITSWLEKLFIETLNRTMVEPRRRCYSLPSVDLKKQAVGGVLSVSVVSAQNLMRLDSKESKSSSSEKWANGDGSSNGNGYSSSHGSGHGSSHGSGSGQKKTDKPKFVEITCEDLTRKTRMEIGIFPSWNQDFDMILHDNTGTLHLNVYEQGPNNVKCDFLGSCEIKMKYVDDDSTMFWAVGLNSGVIAARAEHCGNEVQLTIPLESAASGEVTVKLVLKEWQFSDGSRAVATYTPSSVIHMQQGGMLGSQPSISPLTGRRLRISAVEGRNLAPMDKTGKSDPYLKLYYGKLMRKTKTVNQDLNPTWNQDFIFQEVGGGEYLKIKCYDADLIGDENMGSARVNLQGLEEGQIKDVWVPLERIKQGEIHLKIEVLGCELEPSFSQNVSENGSNGERGMVEVVLVEARDLVAKDWGGTSDPYVSARYGNIKKHTKVVYKTLAPTWGQTLEFTDDGSPLVLHVKDYNTILPTCSIGHCEVEYDRLPPNQTLDQWLPLQGVNKGEIHIQVTRRVPEKLLKNFDLTKFVGTPSSNTKLQRSAGKVRSLIRKALALAEEEEETDDIRIMLEELENAEEEREGTILQLQKDRDLLVCKVKELEQAMSGFF